MESIGARVVNELYLSHMFSLGLSLHAGTESLTYPYGTPNHIKSSHKIQMIYKEVDGKIKPFPTSRTFQQANFFKSSKLDEVEGKGSDTPDTAGISSNLFIFIYNFLNLLRI